MNRLLVPGVEDDKSNRIILGDIRKKYTIQ